MSSPRRALIPVGFVALVLGVGAFVVVLNGGHNVHRGAYAALTLVIGWGFTGTGLYAWRERPGSNNIGPLMIAVGFSGLLKALAFSNNSVIFTIGSLGEVLIWALLIHLLLSFPYGRLESGVDRLIVAVGYFNATVVQVAGFVLTDPAKAGCADCPANPLLITHSAASAAIRAAQVDISIALFGAVVAILYMRWRDSAPNQRRAFAPVLAVGSLTLALLLSELIVEQANLSSTVADRMTLAIFASLACLPFAFFVGLLRARFSRADAISSVVGRLGGERWSGRVAKRTRRGAWRPDPRTRVLGSGPGRVCRRRRSTEAARFDPRGEDCDRD